MYMHIESTLYVHPLLIMGHIFKPMCIPSTQNNPHPWGNFSVPPMVDDLGILIGH